jgi:hypothetical protein
MSQYPRRKNQGRRTPTPPLQRMGGKEERVSDVGRARARVERREEKGERRFDVAPGPTQEELLKGDPGPATAVPLKKVSRLPRAGPGEIEPETKTATNLSGSLEAKAERQPKEPLPQDPDSPPSPGSGTG